MFINKKSKNERLIPREIDTSMITSSVRSQKGKDVATRCIESCEQTFVNTPVQSYSCKEFPTYVMLIVTFGEDTLISQKQIMCIADSLLDCYQEHRIDFKENSLLFHLSSIQTGKQVTQVTDFIKRTVTISTVEFDKIVNTEEFATSFQTTHSNN